MIRFLLIALTLFAAGPALAQKHEAPEQRIYTQGDLWSRSGDRVSFRLGGVSFPTTLGSLRLRRTVEASREGQGLDNALLYATGDDEVFATVYVYAPALADAALTAFMTDYAIGLQSGPDFRRISSGVVAAGGRPGVAFRADYSGFRQNRLASSAAFMRVGRWIVKLRVSGPEARRGEVENAMNALLREIRFEDGAGPATIVPIVAPDCRQTPSRPARFLRSTQAETAEDMLTAHSLAGRGTDPGQSDEPGTPPSRRRWCRSAGYTVPGASSPTPVLRDETPGDGSRRSVVIAIWGDNGVMLEVVEQRSQGRTRYVAIHHQIGQTTILGAFDAVPTDAQLRAIATGEDRDGSLPRASIAYQAGGDSAMTIEGGPPAAVAPPTT